MCVWPNSAFLILSCNLFLAVACLSFAFRCDVIFTLVSIIRADVIGISRLKLLLGNLFLDNPHLVF